MAGHDKQSTMRLAVAIAGFFMLSACSGNPQFQTVKSEHEAILNNKVFVVNHGWHTGLIIPGNFLVKDLSFLNNRFGAARYFEFGWGDKDFYQAEEVTTGLTLQSILWPTQSVVHVNAIPINPPDFYAGAEIVSIALSDHELTNLQKFISNSFYRSESGSVAMQQTGLLADSQFYTGTGKYYLFNTCNTWIAKGLESAGLDISPTFKLTADSIMSFLKGRFPNRTVNPEAGKR